VTGQRKKKNRKKGRSISSSQREIRKEKEEKKNVRSAGKGVCEKKERGGVQRTWIFRPVADTGRRGGEGKRRGVPEKKRKVFIFSCDGRARKREKRRERERKK